MKYLNLTKGFNPYDAKPSECIEFESFFFSGGEPHIKIKKTTWYLEDVVVTSRLTSMNDFMMLLTATDALSRLGWVGSKHLFIPYFSGSRQDRVMVSGEPLSVKMFAEMINFQGFDSVTTFDNHSDVSTALINNCDNLNNHGLVRYCLDDIYKLDKGLNHYLFNQFKLISPDSGANKKIYSLSSNYYVSRDGCDIVKCDKTRNITNGNIIGFDVYGDNLQGKDCIVVDDLCDGGGTFLGLAKELKAKGAGDIYLIVSHGIFSKPLKELKPYFKKIYTTDSWRSEFDWETVERDATDLVEIIEFKDFINII